MKNEIKVRTSMWAFSALCHLARSGRFPCTPEAVAEELLRAKLRELELEGWLAKPAEFDESERR